MFMRGGHGVSKSVASACRVYSSQSAPQQVATRGPARQENTGADGQQPIPAKTSRQGSMTIQQLQDQHDLYSPADVLRSIFLKSEHDQKIRLRNRDIIERIQHSYKPPRSLWTSPRGGDLIYGRDSTKQLNKSDLDDLKGMLSAQIFACITPEDLTRVVTQAAKVRQVLGILSSQKIQLQICKRSKTYHEPVRALTALNHLIRHLQEARLPILHSTYHTAACLAARACNLTALKKHVSSLVVELSACKQSLSTSRARELLLALRSGFVNATARDLQAARRIFFSNNTPSPILRMLRDQCTQDEPYLELIATLGTLNISAFLESEYEAFATTPRPPPSSHSHPFALDLAFTTAFFASANPSLAWTALSRACNTSTPTSDPVSLHSPTPEAPPTLHAALSSADATLWTHLFTHASHMPNVALSADVRDLLKARFLEMLEAELVVLETRMGVEWMGGADGRHSEVDEMGFLKGMVPEFDGDGV